jgi:flagellar basal-body rod protein FlgB
MREGDTLALLDRLFGPHVNNLQNALGRTAQRHSLLTSNLANLNTPGFKRRDLDFGIAIDRESDRISKLDKWRCERQGMAGQDSSIRVDGSNVDLEREVFAIAETELRYQALSDMTAQYFSGLKNVIREGK